MKALLAENWDAIFVGSGAPRGRDLDIPGRRDAAKNIHIGIDWLSSVPLDTFPKSAGAWLSSAAAIPRWIVVAPPAGSAASRSTSRSAPGLEEMKASPWEKEDAMHEGIPIHNYLVPKEFTHENGTLTGITFEKVKAEYDAKGRRKLVPSGEPDQHFACDDVLVAVGQENAFPWIERDIGIEFDQWDMPKVDTKTMASTQQKFSSAVTRPSARRTSSGPSRRA